VDWVEIFSVFLVSHLAGDFLVQSDWQATHKAGGLGRDHVARTALLNHTATYGLCFLPALIWISAERSLGIAIAAAALVVAPHLIQDDGRLITTYARRVKGLISAPGGLMVALDQSFHVVALFLAALILAA